MDQPLQVEVVAYAPTAFYHCTHCEVLWHEMDTSRPVHQEQVAASLPGDLTQEYQHISDWVAELFKRYCDQVEVKVIDATSLEGFYKTFRYGIHHYPAVIVGQKVWRQGNTLETAGQEIARILEEKQATHA